MVHRSTEDMYRPYRVSINVKEKEEGNYVYSFSAEKENGSDTPGTLHALVNGISPANVKTDTLIVEGNKEKVKPDRQMSTREQEKEYKPLQLNDPPKMVHRSTTSAGAGPS